MELQMPVLMNPNKEQTQISSSVRPLLLCLETICTLEVYGLISMNYAMFIPTMCVNSCWSFDSGCGRFQCKAVVVLKHQRWSQNSAGSDTLTLVVLVQSAHSRIGGSDPKFIGFAQFILPTCKSGEKKSSQDKRKEAPMTRRNRRPVEKDAWNAYVAQRSGHEASRVVKTQVCIHSGWEDKHPSALRKWGQQTTDAAASVLRSIKSMRQAAFILRMHTHMHTSLRTFIAQKEKKSPCTTLSALGFCISSSSMQSKKRKHREEGGRETFSRRSKWMCGGDGGSIEQSTREAAVEGRETAAESAALHHSKTWLLWDGCDCVIITKKQKNA